VLGVPSGGAQLIEPTSIRLRIVDDDVTPDGCTPSAEILCLQHGRFALDVEWRDFAGRRGRGQAAPALTRETGYFWFFGPANVEVVAKVLDGRAQNGHFWVFYGSLSNVGYTLTVRDTVTGQVREYVNPLGHFASAGDVRAFAAD